MCTSLIYEMGVAFIELPSYNRVNLVNVDSRTNFTSGPDQTPATTPRPVQSSSTSAVTGRSYSWTILSDFEGGKPACRRDI